MKATQPIRSKQQVQQLFSYYQNKGETRNRLLIIFSVFSALRVSDVLRVSWGNVYDFETKQIKSSITLVEKKTGKIKTIALNKKVTRVLKQYLRETEISPGMPLFINKRTGKAIGRVQAYRIIREAADAIALRERVSCHSLRKTFGYHAWKSGVSPAVIMEIYNHSSFAVTRRYLGVSQDDKNAVYLGLDFAG